MPTMTPTVTTAPTASWPVGVFGRGRSHPAAGDQAGHQRR